MSSSLYEIPDNCNFEAVYNDSEEYECSPKLKDRFFSEFSGLLINAPKKVVWPENAVPEEAGPFGTTQGPVRLMVAGLARFEYAYLGLNGEFGEHVLVIAEDKKASTGYSGKMPTINSLPPDFDMPAGFEASEMEKKALITNHFNLDLVHDLRLPLRDAGYRVYATLGEVKSNVVEIQTKIAGS